MANTFKNSITGSIGTTETTIYTTPALTTSTVIGVSVANVVASNINVGVKLYDADLATSVYLLSGSLLPAGSNVVLVGGDQKVVLETGDYLTLVSNTATSADAVVSVLEIS